MARLMLSLGAACSLVAGDGLLPPLSAAARDGDLSVLRALLAAGADPNASGDGGARWPPLMHAVHAGQLDAARLLLDRRADPNRSPNGHTALMMAAAETDPMMLILLLDYGADPYAHGPGGMSALTVAVSGGAATDINRPIAGGHPATLAALLARAPDLRLPSNAAGREARFWAEVHARIQQAHDIASGPPAETSSTRSCRTPLEAGKP